MQCTMNALCSNGNLSDNMRPRHVNSTIGDENSIGIDGYKPMFTLH